MGAMGGLGAIPHPGSEGRLAIHKDHYDDPHMTNTDHPWDLTLGPADGLIEASISVISTSFPARARVNIGILYRG